MRESIASTSRGPCIVCTRMTHNVDVAWEAYMCDDICAEVMNRLAQADMRESE